MTQPLREVLAQCRRHADVPAGLLAGLDSRWASVDGGATD